MNKKSIVSLSSCRYPKQIAEMKHAAKTGICPFCTIDHAEDRVIYEGTYWYLKYNLYPYSGHKHHFVLVVKRHITTFSELTPEEKLEWFNINEYAMKRFKITGGALVMRFGDMNLSGGSIAHLHSHIQVPELNGKFAISVFAKNTDLETFLKKCSKKQ